MQAFSVIPARGCRARNPDSPRGRSSSSDPRQIKLNLLACNLAKESYSDGPAPIIVAAISHGSVLPTPAARAGESPARAPIVDGWRTRRPPREMLLSPVAQQDRGFRPYRGRRRCANLAIAGRAARWPVRLPRCAPIHACPHRSAGRSSCRLVFLKQPNLHLRVVEGWGRRSLRSLGKFRLNAPPIVSLAHTHASGLRPTSTEGRA